MKEIKFYTIQVILLCIIYNCLGFAFTIVNSYFWKSTLLFIIGVIFIDIYAWHSHKHSDIAFFHFKKDE